jgi:hypothetical protein
VNRWGKPGRDERHRGHRGRRGCTRPTEARLPGWPRFMIFAPVAAPTGPWGRLVATTGMFAGCMRRKNRAVESTEILVAGAGSGPLEGPCPAMAHRLACTRGAHLRRRRGLPVRPGGFVLVAVREACSSRRGKLGSTVSVHRLVWQDVVTEVACAGGRGRSATTRGYAPLGGYLIAAATNYPVARAGHFTLRLRPRTIILLNSSSLLFLNIPSSHSSHHP